MKNFKYLVLVCVLSLVTGLVLTSCQDEDQEFGDIIIPTNLAISFEVVGVDADNPFGDGSGFVNFTATADNAITFRYAFGDNTSDQVAPNGTATHRFSQQGVNTYIVTVIASGTGGVSTTSTVEVEVFSAFDDQEAKDFLTGGAGSSKTWYLAASEPGHLGVGPSLLLDLEIHNGVPTAFYFPQFFSAAPFEKCGIEISDCLCTDELTFTQDGNNDITYQLNNNGATFFNASHQDIVGGSVGEDACFDFDTSGVSDVVLTPSTIDWTLIPDPGFEQPRGTVLNFTNDAFMGYYVSSSQYEIMSISDNELYVRTIDGLDPNLAWYHKYSTSPPDADNDLESQFNNLIWADEFDTNGAPDPANWTYDIGTGTDGWGNFESQYYTDDASNVVVQDGNLVITARAESFMGSNYTSARIKSEDLVEFTYGRVEIRAKLPEGGGTWPALWMLGANFPEISWPASGEIDIMEHRGNDLNTIVCNIFYPNENGDPVNQGGTTNATDVTNEFHNYTVEWREDEILFAIDNEVYFTVDTAALPEFDLDFFLIMNIAMGGTFGGDIDPAFTESSMEVDYVRVYQ